MGARAPGPALSELRPPKAPSASVESIEPRPPRPCEVGRPKGRRRKNRRQSHNFFQAPATPHSGVRGDSPCRDRCSDRPIAALHFLLPTLLPLCCVESKQPGRLGPAKSDGSAEGEWER